MDARTDRKWRDLTKVSVKNDKEFRVQESLYESEQLLDTIKSSWFSVREESD